MRIKAVFCLAVFLATTTMLAAQLTPPASTSCGTSATLSMNWSQLGFDPCHTFFNPSEVIIGPSNVSDLVVAWKYATGGAIGELAVANGVVYFGSYDGNVYAVNATTGTFLWSFPTGAQGAPVPPAVAYGLVYVASHNGPLYALNAKTGAVVWRASGTRPTVGNGVVYAGLNGLSALDAHTGALLWHYFASAPLTGSPAVVNGLVYFGTSENIYALDAATGVPRWQQPATPSSEIGVVDGGVYYAQNGGTPSVMALDANTGAVRWGTGLFTSMDYKLAAAHGLLYFGVRLYREDTWVLWISDDTNGHYKGDYYFDNEDIYPLLVANGVLYIGSQARKLYGIAIDGPSSWTYPLGTQPTSAALVNGMLFVGGLDGNLYAFHLPRH